MHKVVLTMCDWRRKEPTEFYEDLTLIISWHLCFKEGSLEKMEGISEQSRDGQFDKLHLLSKLAVKGTILEKKDWIGIVIC